MSPANNPNAAVIDASILVSITAKEAATHLTAENAFKAYSQNGWEFFAPNVIVAEVIFALCQKLAAGILTEAEYKKAVESFLDYMTIISTPNDETDLVKRAVEIRETYGCSRSSDGLYIALAEDLAKARTVELLTFDKGMKNQAAKNAPTVTVNVL
ncbi:MAG: type II toxin-antitoxin system VapC family toxin [Acidobacteriota bacterium]|nr:type II toxin-antitoxin system VapC family toxin [Acidobacteriota bacterium]